MIANKMTKTDKIIVVLSCSDKPEFRINWCLDKPELTLADVKFVGYMRKRDPMTWNISSQSCIKKRAARLFLDLHFSLVTTMRVPLKMVKLRKFSHTD